LGDEVFAHLLQNGTGKLSKSDYIKASRPQPSHDFRERARLVDLHIERMMERKAEADRNYAIAEKLGPLLHKLTRKG
jgi:hypothetical protein